jgi:hypothetical protein
VGRVPDNDNTEAACICGECPSKNREDLTAYCATGKSGMAVRRRGCLCGDCSVYRDYDLTRGYYCDEGVTE